MRSRSVLGFHVFSSRCTVSGLEGFCAAAEKTCFQNSVLKIRQRLVGREDKLQLRIFSVGFCAGKEKPQRSKSSECHKVTSPMR